MNEEVILPVVDNSGDEKLTLLALARSNMGSRSAVARNAGSSVEPGQDILSQLALSDLKLLKMRRLEILDLLRDNKPTRRLEYRLRANLFLRTPVDSMPFAAADAQSGLRGCWWFPKQLSPRSV